MAQLAWDRHGTRGRDRCKRRTEKERRVRDERGRLKARIGELAQNEHRLCNARIVCCVPAPTLEGAAAAKTSMLKLPNTLKTEHQKKGSQTEMGLEQGAFNASFHSIALCVTIVRFN